MRSIGGHVISILSFVFFHSYSIPVEGSKEFETFCWTQLLLYKPFCDVGSYIGLCTKIIVENWRNWRYHAWYVDRGPFPNEGDEEDAKPLIHEFEEWKLFSQLVPLSSINVSDLDNLSRGDFDVDYNW